LFFWMSKELVDRTFFRLTQTYLPLYLFHFLVYAISLVRAVCTWVFKTCMVTVIMAPGSSSHPHRWNVLLDVPVSAQLSYLLLRPSQTVAFLSVLVIRSVAVLQPRFSIYFFFTTPSSRASFRSLVQHFYQYCINITKYIPLSYAALPCYLANPYTDLSILLSASVPVLWSSCSSKRLQKTILWQ
jgi:hypothetical protein